MAAGIALELRAIGLVHDAARPAIGTLGELNVLGDIDHDRTRAARRGDVERLMQHARQVVHVAHQVIVLGARPGDADRIAFLESVVADEMRRDLPGDARRSEWNPSSASVSPVTTLVAPGPEVTSTHAGLAGGARIAFRRVRRALLVTHEQMADAVLLEQRVIDRQHRAAGITENILDALIEEGLQKDLRPSHHASHVATPRYPRRCPGEGRVLHKKKPCRVHYSGKASIVIHSLNEA